MAPNYKPLVLVTGATGHLGFRTLVLALQAGYRARVVYRSESTLAKVKEAASTKHFQQDLEYVRVPDMTADGAFDEVVKGVDYFLHIASPIFDTSEAGGEVRDWQKEFYHPALQGTVVALASALKEPNIKRVVITSSVVAVEAKDGNSLAGPNDVKDMLDRETLNNFTLPAHAYVYSKVMAHRAVDDWIKDHPKAHFDVVRVLPGYIQGANELARSTKEAAVGSNEGTFNMALGNISPGPKPTAQIYLDDIAETHVVALDKKKVEGGKALIAVANEGKGWMWDDFVPVVERLYPDEVKKGVLKPRKGQEGGRVAFDVHETIKVLGHDFAGIETMVKSVVEQYLKLQDNKGTP